MKSCLETVTFEYSVGNVGDTFLIITRAAQIIMDVAYNFEELLERIVPGDSLFSVKMFCWTFAKKACSL